MTLTGCRRSKRRKKGRSGWRIKNMKTRRTWIINNLKFCRKCYAVLWTQVLSVILFVVLKLQHVSGLPLELVKTYFWPFFKVSDIVGLVWAWEFAILKITNNFWGDAHAIPWEEYFEKQCLWVLLLAWLKL